MKQTIVHLIAGLGAGGAERQLLYLVGGLRNDNVRHVVVSMTDSGVLGDDIEAAGGEVHCLNMARGRISVSGFFRLYRLLKGLDVQVLQTWMYHAGLLGLIAGRLAGVSSVVWNVRCSNMDFSDYGRLTRWVVEICARLSRFVPVAVVNSVAGRVWHEKLGFNPPVWKLIYNGFDLDRFNHPHDDAKAALCETLGINPSSRLVGLVARYDPMKAHVDFLAAAGPVADKVPDVHFVLIGTDVDDGNRALRDAVRDNGLAGHVHMLGRRDDIAKLTAAFDIAVSASAYGEGFPNTIGEAMASGVPCVVTDVGDSAAIVGDLGWVVPPRDPDALAQALCEALEQDGRACNERREAVRAHMKRRYGLDVMTAAYHDLYASLGVRFQGQGQGAV